MEIYAQMIDEEIQKQYKLISMNIKRLRQEKKITQENIALSMGFTTATFYTNAENNKQGKHFNLEHIIKISKILNISIEHFFIENSIKSKYTV
jgi:transcriptional regulator with XRE-family HTH domain